MRVFAALFMLSCLLCGLTVKAAQIEDMQLDAIADQGRALFANATFNGNGKKCESCHPNGGVGPGRSPTGKVLASLTNAATIFPVYKTRQARVFTLEDQLVNCVEVAMEGKSPAYGSADMNALIVYVTSLSQGKPIDMGGSPK